MSFCNDSPTVSILMGVYNPDRCHVKEAIDSLLHQTYHDWELLIINDGSREHITEEIKRYSNIDERMKYLHIGANKGLAFALNVGIAEARGMYLARMDADDVSHPERLMEQVKFLEANPEYGWVGTRAYLFDHKGIWGEENMEVIPQKESFLRYSPFIHPSVMFRREIFQKYGGYREAKETERCEDYELFMRLYRNGERGYNLERRLLYYREDVHSYKRRTVRAAFHEMKVRQRGFLELGILKPWTLHQVLRPLLVATLPSALIKKRRRQRNKNNGQANKLPGDSARKSEPL